MPLMVMEVSAMFCGYHYFPVCNWNTHYKLCHWWWWRFQLFIVAIIIFLFVTEILTINYAIDGDGGFSYISCYHYFPAVFWSSLKNLHLQIYISIIIIQFSFPIHTHILGSFYCDLYRKFFKQIDFKYLCRKHTTVITLSIGTDWPEQTM